MLKSAYLHNVLIPAVPVPFDAQGKIDASAQERYARWMAQQPIEGVAVWAHTGRGLRLAETERAMVLECWRNSVPAPRLVIAAAGASPGMADPGQVILSARSMARQALDLAPMPCSCTLPRPFTIDLIGTPWSSIITPRSPRSDCL